MLKLSGLGFWSSVARIILRNKLIILSLIAIITVLLAFQWKHMRFTYTEANLLPKDHPANEEYDRFLTLFGEEGDLILIGADAESLFNPKVFNGWKALHQQLEQHEAVANVVSVTNLKKLEKNNDTKRFDLIPIATDSLDSAESLERFKTMLYETYPFYEGLLFSEENQSFRSLVFLKKEIVNTRARKDFVFNDFIPLIDAFEKNYKVDVSISGMPYVRSQNAQHIVDEIEVFILAAMLMTGGIFFFLFRSLRATIISLITVVIGVMWSFGYLGLLRFEITVLTALIPPLIIVIGIANCIFLINKFQHEYKTHGNRVLSLQRVIRKIGNATLLTNLTTASGFATFIVTNNKLLIDFGILASLSIISIFLISLCVVPILYTFMPPPQEKHLKHLEKRWLSKLVKWMERNVRHRRITVFSVAVILLILGLVGINRIKISGSMLEDLPQKEQFVKDIRYFDENFNGILPLEIHIDTQRPKSATKTSVLKKIDALESNIVSSEYLSSPISITRIVKYAKQAFYNNNPDYYQLPASQERAFILPYLQSEENRSEWLEQYVDSTGQHLRLTAYMRDLKTEEIEAVEAELQKEIAALFPEDQFKTSVTGKAMLFLKGTNYLIGNLSLSLALAIVLIIVLIAILFRSWKMIVISLIPNLLPLIVTAGLMGFLNVPIKPSTILIFSIAFGISVDDTIHFLAKYRQELIASNWKIKRSVYKSLRETGISMFYSSVVLFCGFSVFTLSGFGGTVALGALVSATLLFAMLSNLLLLPALLLSLEKTIANKQTIKTSEIKILSRDDDQD